jgi:glucuronokinase
METWAGYAERGRSALLTRDYATLNRLVDANFDLRSRIYRISEGNLEMIQLARKAGACANFAGSGGAIVGIFEDEKMYQSLVTTMQPAGIALVKPMVMPNNSR